MTTPAQPGPYPGQSGASWPTAAPAPGQAAAPYPSAPQPGANPYGYNYGWASPAYGYAQPPGPGASPQDRGTAILLLLGAALAVGGSFPALTKAVDTTGTANDTLTYYDKPWQLSTQGNTFNDSALQFLGLPLAIGATAAVVIGILLLIGFGVRRGPVRALGLAASGILFGATLVVMMVAVDDGQFDNTTHHTTFQLGFWLIVLSAVASLGAAVPGIAARFGSPTDASQSAVPAAVPAYGMQPPAGLQPPTAQYMQQAQPQPQPQLQQAYAPQPQVPQQPLLQPQPQPQVEQMQQTQQMQQPAPQPQPQPPFDSGAGWAQPGQTGAPAPASPEDPQQPVG